jgi:uncharacterized membrane protein YgcG
MYSMYVAMQIDPLLPLQTHKFYSSTKDWTYFFIFRGHRRGGGGEEGEGREGEKGREGKGRRGGEGTSHSLDTFIGGRGGGRG